MKFYNDIINKYVPELPYNDRLNIAWNAVSITHSLDYVPTNLNKYIKKFILLFLAWDSKHANRTAVLTSRSSTECLWVEIEVDDGEYLLEFNFDNNIQVIYKGAVVFNFREYNSSNDLDFFTTFLSQAGMSMIKNDRSAYIPIIDEFYQLVDPNCEDFFASYITKKRDNYSKILESLVTIKPTIDADVSDDETDTSTTLVGSNFAKACDALNIRYLGDIDDPNKLHLDYTADSGNDFSFVASYEKYEDGSVSYWHSDGPVNECQFDPSVETLTKWLAELLIEQIEEYGVVDDDLRRYEEINTVDITTTTSMPKNIILTTQPSDISVWVNDPQAKLFHLGMYHITQDIIIGYGHDDKGQTSCEFIADVHSSNDHVPRLVTESIEKYIPHVMETHPEHPSPSDIKITKPIISVVDATITSEERKQKHEDSYLKSVYEIAREILDDVTETMKESDVVKLYSPLRSPIRLYPETNREQWWLNPTSFNELIALHAAHDSVASPNDEKLKNKVIDWISKYAVVGFSLEVLKSDNDEKWLADNTNLKDWMYTVNLDTCIVSFIASKNLTNWKIPELEEIKKVLPQPGEKIEKEDFRTRYDRDDVAKCISSIVAENEVSWTVLRKNDNSDIHIVKNIPENNEAVHLIVSCSCNDVTMFKAVWNLNSNRLDRFLSKHENSNNEKLFLFTSLLYKNIISMLPEEKSND